MAKGASIKFKGYSESIPKLLELIKLNLELPKHNKIVLKPSLKDDSSVPTKAAFVESVLAFCLKYKNPEAQIFIAEGSDGVETMDLFEKEGYKAIAEKYGVGLVDLNNADVQTIQDGNFLKFTEIQYPQILTDAFIISLVPLAEDQETDLITSTANMLGTFPAKYYSSFFSSRKSKIRKWPIRYSIHDILTVKMPQLAVIDSSDKGTIMAGVPLEMDKHAAKILGKEWRSIMHLRLLEESFNKEDKKSSQSLI